jgi:TonB-dependent receptor
VRLERTRFEASGIQAQFDDDSDEALFNPVRASSDYSDVLPQLGFRYDLGPRTLLRAALTRSVSRANFSDLTPGAEISITRNDDGSIDEREISTGNPFLDPYRADNLDLAWEFYPDGLGAVTAGMFYKHITDFVVRANLAGRDEYADYTFADVPINGDSADLYGLELSWTQQLGWLPAPFDGLFVNANATWADSTANLALREDSIPLPNQSRVLANLVLGYENGPVSLRLSNSFRDKRLTDLDDPEDSGQDIYERSHLQVDFSAKYRLTDGWRLYADAINLTDRPYYRRYAGGGVAQYEKYGRVYQFGIEASF